MPYLLVRPICLHQRVDDERVVDAPQLHAQLASLAVERDALAKTSTWPWDTATLTTFVTTLVLPDPAAADEDLGRARALRELVG